MQRVDIKKAVKAISSVLPKRRPIGHHEPYTTECEARHVNTLLEQGITTDYYPEWFQEKLKVLTGAEQAIVVSNGTAALHLALIASGVIKGDEVLVPTMTYVATANAVVHAGAAPNFIDGSFCLNPYKLRCYLERETAPIESGKGRLNLKTLQRISALIMVHLLGMPCNHQEIRKITDQYGLILIEDAAEALGSRDGNVPCGNMGDVSVLSFNHNKIVTTGGGGAILSDDPFIIAKAHHLAHQGRTAHPWRVEHDELGWNYAMPPICAALGVAQLEHLPQTLYRKRKLAFKYYNTLKDIAGLNLLMPLEGFNNWLIPVLTDYSADRDTLLEALHDEAINARAQFSPLHTLPFYEHNPRDSMGYAENSAERTLCLPSGAGLCE